MEHSGEEQPAEPVFLDVEHLLAASEPRQRGNWFWFGIGLFMLLVMGSFLASGQSPQGALLIRTLAALVMVLLFLLLPALTYVMVRRVRGDQLQIEAAAELVQLRRWPQAALSLQDYLSRPARTLSLRSEALIYLASVLARYHRFDDAVRVQTYLIEQELVDPGTAYGLRLGRAMAMLREDHLFDADRAISDLRRLAGQNESGGLALVEIYRDVKTGHPREAIELFEKRLPVLREQLGHRVADAHALIARAFDLLDNTAEAQAAFRRATLLSPFVELVRRYPELEKLSGRYVPAPAPVEMA